MVTPVHDLKQDWRNWVESDRKVLMILRGLLELPLAFGLWMRLTLHIGTLNAIHDFRGESHPDIDGSVSLTARSPVKKPTLDPRDDLYIRIISAAIALALFSTPVFPLYPEELVVALLLYGNFALLILDPVLFWVDRAHLLDSRT